MKEDKTERTLDFLQKMTSKSTMLISSLIGLAVTLYGGFHAYRAGKCSIGKLVLCCIFIAILFPAALWMAKGIGFGCAKLVGYNQKEK